MKKDDEIGTVKNVAQKEIHKIRIRILFMSRIVKMFS